MLAVLIISFLLLAPLFGYLGDRYNRKYIMICGLSMWIVTSVSSSFVTKSVRKKETSWRKLGCNRENMCLVKYERCNVNSALCKYCITKQKELNDKYWQIWEELSSHGCGAKTIYHLKECFFFFFKCCTRRSTALRLEYLQDLHPVNMAGDKQPAHVRKQRLSSAIFVWGRPRMWEHFP